MLRSAVAAALLAVVLGAPVGACAQDEALVQLVDLQTAHGLPRGAYSLGVRVVPDGGLVAGLRVGLAPYLLVGVSYGAGNVVGSGEPAWEDRVEFDVKLRLAEEYGAIPALALGYDSRAYGGCLGGDGEDGASPGFYVAAAKTLPFSEYWELHFGVSRTLDEAKAKPDVFVGASARFSQEFSVLAEYRIGLDRGGDDPEATTGYLNLGFRWVFMNQLEIDLLFRNLVGPSDSSYLSSRSMAFVYYDSF